MRLDPLRIGFLRLTAAEEQLRADRIPQAGESIASVATRFAVLPELEYLRLADAST